jgi:hypothetical protein
MEGHPLPGNPVDQRPRIPPKKFQGVTIQPMNKKAQEVNPEPEKQCPMH